MYIYHGWKKIFWGEGEIYASFKYNLQKYSFHMTVKNTPIDLKADLRLGLLSSDMINELQVSGKWMFSASYLCREHLLLINVTPKYGRIYIE